MYQITSQRTLRLGLSFIFLYAGIASFVNPADWLGYVPVWVEDLGIQREWALMAHAIGDIALGLWIAVGIRPAWAGLVAGMWLWTVVLATGPGSFPVTFRDIGLSLAAFAYALRRREK